MQTLNGSSLIGKSEVTRDKTFVVSDRNTGDILAPAFNETTTADVEKACALAAAAFDSYRSVSLEERAVFLETIAENILGLGDELIVRAMAESGLPRPRLEGERGRQWGSFVCSQRLFAKASGLNCESTLRCLTALRYRGPIFDCDIFRWVRSRCLAQVIFRWLFL